MRFSVLRSSSKALDSTGSNWMYLDFLRLMNSRQIIFSLSQSNKSDDENSSIHNKNLIRTNFRC
jgi:hypothetical protein